MRLLDRIERRLSWCTCNSKHNPTLRPFCQLAFSLPLLHLLSCRHMFPSTWGSISTIKKKMGIANSLLKDFDRHSFKSTVQSYLNLKKHILEVDKSTLVETPSAEVVLWSDPFPENYEKRINCRTCSLTDTCCKIKYQRSPKYIRQDLKYNGTIVHVIDLKPNRSHC